MDDPGLTSIERLKHIEEAISKIEKFCQDIDEQNFLEDEQVNSSVLYQFIVIGEAVRFVNPEILKKYPYAWHLPRSFRNYVAHEYFGINLKQVYKTVKDTLPEFKGVIQNIIESEANE